MMASSSGNPKQQPQGGFDMHKLSKPSSGPINMNNLTTSPSFPSPSPSPSPSSSSTPPPPPYLTPSSSYPPLSGPSPFHHRPNCILYPPPPHHARLNPFPSSFWSPSQPTTTGPDTLMPFLTNHKQLPQPSPPDLSPSPSSPEFSAPPLTPSPPPSTMVSPTRLISTKLPKGRHLDGNQVVYDIDIRLPGEAQPQLEVTPITKYASDPGLVLGRQIAVNRNYICYGLKLGAIRILNIITAMRSLFRGHTQRVTDMAFFAEDVNLLASASADGRVFIWKINERPDEEDKPQIFGKVVFATQIVGQWESIHPRLCWHPHKQEILMIAIGNCILKVDTRVGEGGICSAEDPLICHIDKLIDGIQLFGKHDDEITELSMCQWMTTRLASASIDGSVKIWEDRRAVPLAVLRPHSGHPVNSVTFLTAPHRPDHIVLITGGNLNRELRLWASAREEGWLLPSDAESWHCTQTLELKSSAAPNIEDAFFNQAVVLPCTGLFLLANAKKNAIYAFHIDYGPNPSATRVDYIAEFTVTMPILSLTGTSESLPGEHTVHVYCVQTQAIQQYALDLSQCLPPSLENPEFEKVDSGFPFVPVSNNSDKSAHDNKSSEISAINSSSVVAILSSCSASRNVASCPERSASSDVSDLLELTTKDAETKSSPLRSPGSSENIHITSSPLPLSPRLSRTSSGFRSPLKSLEPSPFSDDGVEQSVTATENKANVPCSCDNVKKVNETVVHNDASVVKSLIHLVTPSEVLSTTVAPSENSQNILGEEAKLQYVAVNNNTESNELEIKVVDKAGNDPVNELESSTEPHITSVEKEQSFYSQASDFGIQVDQDMEMSSMEGTQQVRDLNVTEVPVRPSNFRGGEAQNLTKDVNGKTGESEAPSSVFQSTPATRGKKHKVKNPQAYGLTSPSSSPYNSADSASEPGCSFSDPSPDMSMYQLSSMQDMLNQLMNMQKETQKQMNSLISGPVSKEGKRLETSLGRSLERVVKANMDVLWGLLQEENGKHEKLNQDQTHQLINVIINFIDKDLSSLLEKTLKKEIAGIGLPATHAITPILEKCVSAAIVESFQRGVGDKAVNQLEKTVGSKLEAILARQIQAEFQTSGKQALQEALRSTLESFIIPAFEMSCKAMFELVDATFQKGLIRHTAALQQQLEITHSPLAIALRDAITSASLITRTLLGELAEGQLNLLSVAAAGTSSNIGSPLQGPLPGVLEIQNEASIDPTKELSRLAAERKYEEAFTTALHRSDVSIVSWLCSQVDLQGIFSMVTIPLSQGVLLALFQQLACDISKDTSRKLAWMTDVAVAINPADPTIAVHVRPILDQVFQILVHQRSLPATTASEASSSRLLMHVINSVLMSCKSL